MYLCTSLLLAGVATLASVSAQSSSFTPLRPPAIPLAVKSPYMSTWQQAGGPGNGGYLAGQWPTFWQGQVTAWAGMIRVDNATYTWMGDPKPSTNYVNQVSTPSKDVKQISNLLRTAFEYTSTRSIFTMSAGPVQMKITFLSTTTPTDLLRSSLPYSYMDVEIVSTDGGVHSVQLYSDISAEWVSGDRSAVAQWEYGNIATESEISPQAFSPAVSAASTSQAPTTYATQTSFAVPTSVAHTNLPIYASGQGKRPSPSDNTPQATYSPIKINAAPASSGIAYHKVFRQQQLEFSQVSEQAEWGSWYFATANTSGLTFQSGADTTVRGNFVNSGALPNSQDTNYRPISQQFPVFGYAVDLGNVGSNSQSTLFQLSLHQQNCVQFQGQKDAVSKLPCMWTNYFSQDTDALQFFYNDYSAGSSMASGFDTQVSTDSQAAGGADYASLTSLAVRQAFAGVEYVNTPAEPLIFMKEISSDGNVNTVDVIFPFHPIAIYTNATILKWLLDPLFINQEAGNWPNSYSIHDIGSNFPNATGHSDGNAEAQPLEECGNMLIMTLAYAQRANDNAYLTQHYQILKQWTGYLIEEALIPADQISTDDFAGSAVNQTNLAIKGIIGIEAMAQIANRTGNAEDGAKYTAIAHDYIDKWQKLAINYDDNPPHTTFQYGNNGSYSLLYNLFGDKELGLELVPQSVYDMQSTFYATKFKKYGVPLDTRHPDGYTKNDWEMFCAAIASDETKAMFTSAVAKWVGETTTNFPFTDLYGSDETGYPGITFIARPVIGGLFAFLALNDAPTNGYITPS